MSDKFESYSANLSSPGSSLAIITPNDDADLVNASRFIMVGTAGALKVTTVAGETLVIPAEVVSSIPLLPIRVTRIFNTGTTADNILVSL